MGLMKKLTSALVASSLVLSLVGSAFAAYTPAAGEEAGTRMQKLGIITGRDGNDLALNSEITRAELVTVIVRAFGKEDDAKLLKGSTIFPDIQNHWASGNIAMAVALVEKAGSDPIGMPDGTFAPDAKLTPAQAVAFLMKFMGAKADATKAWPANYLDVAVEKGLITTEDKALIAPMLNDNATRGLVFYMFDRAFAEYNLGAGKTFYTKYVDTIAPELTVTEPAATTMDSKVTISGKATGANEVFVGTTKVTLAADGSFSFDYDLPELTDYNISVVAKDLAGNSAEESFTVTRTTGNAASVEASLAAELLKAGTETELTVVVNDKNGNAIEGADYDVEITGEIGTYADGVFTAAEKPATGTITITSGEATPAVLDVAVIAGDIAKIVVEPAAPTVAVGTPIQFTAKGVDAFGNEVAGNLNVTWTKTGGVIDAQGNFVGTQSGSFTVTATSGAVSGTATASVYGVATALKLDAISDIVANGKSETKVAATVVDATGNVVTGYNGVVNFYSSNSSLIKLASGSVNAVNGRAEVTLESAGTTAGTAVISAAAAGLTGTTANAKAVAQVLTSVKAEIGTSTLGADGTSSTLITFTELDQAGVEMGTYTDLALTLTNSNTSAVTVSSSFSLASGTKTLEVRSAGATEGSATVTAAVTTAGKTGIPVGSVTVSTLQVGVPAAIVVDTVADATVDAAGVDAADKVQAIKVKVVDAKGNQVTNPAINLNTVLKISADPAASLFENDGTTAYNNTNGVKPVGGSYTFKAKATAADAYTYKVTASFDPDGAGAVAAYALEAKTVTGNFVAGPVRSLTLSAAPAPGASTAAVLSADGVATGSLKATLADSRGNAVNSGSYTVTFTKTSDNNATADFTDNKATAVTADGAASMTVSATRTQQTDTFQAYVTMADGTTKYYSNTVTVQTLIMGVPTAATVDAPATFEAGVEGKVKVAIKDAKADFVTTDNGRVVTLKAFDGDTELGAFTGTTTNGIASIPVTLTKALATVTFKATVDGITAANVTTDTAAVTHTDAAKISLTSDLTTLAADGASKAKLTVKVLDAYDNVVTSDDTTQVKIKVDGTTYGNFETAPAADTGITLTVTDGVATTVDDADGAGAGTASNHLKVSGVPGSVTLTASVANSTLTNGTVAITTIYGGFYASQFSVATVADTEVGGTMKIKVTVLDAQGNRVTNYGENIQVVTSNTNVDLDSVTPLKQASLTKAAVKGYAEFSISSDIAESVTFTVKDARVTVAMADKAVTGVFTPATASALAIGTPSKTVVPADGAYVVTVPVYVQDSKGNTVAGANGTAKVEITDGADYAVVTTPTITISGGVGSFQIQSKFRETAKAITVKVSSTDIFKADGTTVVTADEEASLLTVDGVVFGTPTGAFSAGNTVLTVTFSKTVDEAQVETAANWTVTRAAGATTITSVVYDNAARTATITVADALASGDTVKLNATSVQDTAKNFYAPATTFTVPTP